jgi:tetratricopeptide (TPR) repeat protein
MRKAGKSPIFLADRARDKRQWERACRYYHEALSRNPDKPAIWVQYGHALKESGNLVEAESAYRKSLALDPSVADTHLQLGHALKIQGKKDEAAAAYLHALALDPTLPYASLELLGLGWSLAGLNEWTMTRIGRALQRENGLLAAEVKTEQSDLVPSVVFDISDLIDYFANDRLPTGIQRVQMNIIEGLLRKTDRNFNIVISCMTRHADFWLRIPDALFLELCELAVAGGKTDDASWRGILAELDLCFGISKHRKCLVASQLFIDD